MPRTKKPEYEVPPPGSSVWEDTDFNHSYMHYARGYYKNARLANRSREANKSNRTFNYLSSVLSSRIGYPVIDESGTCTLCGKGVDE